MRRQRSPERELIHNNILAQMEDRLKKIDYDFSKFTIHDFAQWVASKRGVDVHLESSELTLPTGFWFMSDDGAHVVFSESLSKMLETITILHELMHIYLGHETKYIPSNYRLLDCFQGIATRDPLQKSKEDQEAEIGALLVYQWSLRRGDSSNPVADLFSDMDKR